MKKILAIATLSAMSSFASAESYQLLSGIGITDSEQDGTDSTFKAGGTYYFTGQNTVGPLDQFGYIDDTSNIRANASSTGSDDIFSVGGSYYFDRFAVGVDHTDDRGVDFYSTRLHGDFFFTNKLKASIGYSIPEEGDEVVDVNLQYDHTINEKDYIGFTLSYVDIENAAATGLSTKYLNAFDNGQFLVLEASVVDIDADNVDTAFNASAKWYLNKTTGLVLGADNDDYMYVGASHFFNSNFAVDATFGQDDDSLGESYNIYNVKAVLQF